MPPTTIDSLSSVIRNKAGGVIFFVTNILKSLHEERLIHFNLTTLRFEFDLESIQAKEVSSDIVDFLSRRIRQLPTMIQAGVKIASCLGSPFHLSVFQRANKSSDEATNEFISIAVESGLLQELSPKQFTWSHDQIYQAAYSLNANMKETTHLLAGTRIYLSAKSGELEGLIHDIVRNMNIGAPLLDNQEQKTELAQLNFIAGNQSKKASALYTASKYFMSGIKLLEEDWQNTKYYNLGMHLYDSA